VVAELWRHPVKSMRGERLQAAAVLPDGVEGDRAWGVRDAGTGRILTARQAPALLMADARLGDDGRPVITLPDGTVLVGCGPATDAVLGAWLGREVALVAAAGADGGRAQYFADATDDASEPIEWTMPAGRFVDGLPVHLLTTASLRAGAGLHADGAWDRRRFRPNLLLEADGTDWAEDGWLGDVIEVGGARLGGLKPCTRCTMITRPQPALPADADMFRTLARHHGATLGVRAGVLVPGMVRVGDVVRVVTR
jgi:uncharacterized protein YcbX